MPDSSRSSRRNKPDKPPKPREDFPLSFHDSGKLCKKIRGTMHYFGRWGRSRNGVVQPVQNLKVALQEAEAEYNLVKDDLHAGRTPRPKPEDGTTVEDACDAFLRSREAKLDAGRLSPMTFRDYFDVGKLVIENFGGNRLVEDLAPADFAKFITWLESKKKHGTNRMAKNIQVTRMIFKYAHGFELIDKPVRFGPDFKGPSKKEKRKTKREAGRKDFQAEEVHRLLSESQHPMRAMILLGVNCGFGQTDIANLPISAVDLEAGWIEFPRPKTEIERRCPLWPETAEALRDALQHRPKPKDDADSGCFFVTSHGRRFVWTTPNKPDKRPARVDPVGQRFTRLKTKTGISGGRGFYGLRHTFATQAGNSRDQVAVNAIMGHADDTMAANYRHDIDDERLRNVVNVVRAWLWSGEQTEGGER